MKRHLRLSRVVCWLAAPALLVWLTAAGEASALTRDEAATLFSKANDLYAAGTYEQAADGYRRLIEQGVDSQAVHFNLGNALFKMRRLGPAIVEYERAARLAPLDEDIRANLQHARSLTADKPSEGGARTTTFFMERLLELTTPDQDARLFASFYVAIGVLWAGLILARGATLRRWVLAGIVVVAVPLTVSGSSLAWKLHRARAMAQAVVLTDRVDVLSAPGEDSTTLFTVHEGLRVDVRERQGSWSRVLLDNGLNGWVPSETLEEI